MTALRLFDRPVHEGTWIRPPGNTDYAVTGQFLGRDLVNGGLHRAVDVGNLRMGDPVIAPRGAVRARGLRNYSEPLPLATDALGVEIDFGRDLLIAAWHLSMTLPVADDHLYPGLMSWGPWQDVSEGMVLGLTGNTGAQVGGKAMPGHTHIEAEDRDVRFDIEPYLLGNATLVPEVAHDDDVDFSAGVYQKPKLVRVLAGAVLYKQPTGNAEHWRVDEAFEAELVWEHSGRFLAHRIGSGSNWWVGMDGLDTSVPFRVARYE